MKNRYKRTYRLIQIIQQIKTVPYQNLEDLLEYLKISRAQFYKDKQALSELGFEFLYNRTKKRFIITKDAFLPVEGLSLSERLSLVMAVRQLSAAGDYILTYEGMNAARKLAADLPTSIRENVISIFDDLVLRKGFGCRREILEQIQRAVGENRRVILAYRRPDHAEYTSEELEPYHLFFRRRALYVEGYSWTEKAIRMYRLNRIRKVEFTPLIFTVRNDYDFGRRHRNAFSAFPGETTEHVAVRFSKRVRPYIEESLWHHSQKITAEKDGGILFELDVAEPREVLWWALGWGADAVILQPAWLQKKAINEIEKLSRSYRGSNE